MFVLEAGDVSRVAQYPVRYFWFHRLDNLLVNGNVALRSGRPKEAAEWFDRAFKGLPFGQAVEGAWQFGNAGNRAWWCSTAAEAYEKAGMPTAANDMRDWAAREKESGG